MRENTNRSPQRRVVAALGALSLSLIGVVGAASPASAADYGNVDKAKPGSIIIHKHVQVGNTQSGSPDGTGSTITSAPVAGVKFTAYKLTDLDLTLATGWAGVPTSVPATACDTPSLSGHVLDSGTVSPATDSNGLATISLTAPNAVGAYLVCETTSPSTVVDKALPFVVTIPYAYNEGWLYNVNVYPKNGLADVSKTVNVQTGLGLGATATFPVTTDVPKIETTANYQYYWVQDKLDTRMTNATVASVKLASTDAAVPASYYTFATNATTNVVSLQFTPTGLAWLKTIAPDKIVTNFTAVVGTLGNGIISDTAYVGSKTAVAAVPTTPNTPPADPSSATGVTPSGVVTQNWGDLKVTKVDKGSTTTGLTGATFQVYAATDPYAATCAADYPVGSSPISVVVSGVTSNSFTTATGGVVTVPGLFVSDNKNATVGATQRCYVLVETAAPAGFVLPADPRTPVAVKIGATVGAGTTIQNTRLSGVNLPMTGSDGIVVFSIAGVALVALGLVVAAVSRRRRSESV